MTIVVQRQEDGTILPVIGARRLAVQLRIDDEATVRVFGADEEIVVHAVDGALRDLRTVDRSCAAQSECKPRDKS